MSVRDRELKTVSQRELGGRLIEDPIQAVDEEVSDADDIAGGPAESSSDGVPSAPLKNAMTGSAPLVS